MAEKEVKAHCPRCGVSIRWGGNPFRPFCSERCKLIDLGTWVDEGYHIAGESAPDEDAHEGR